MGLLGSVSRSSRESRAPGDEDYGGKWSKTKLQTSPQEQQILVAQVVESIILKLLAC